MTAALALGTIWLAGFTPKALAEAPVYFADWRLQRAVGEGVGVYWPAPIYPSDMLRLTFLGVNDVTDLTGLEYAANLQRLAVGGATWWDPPGVTSIAPLAGLTKLESVALVYNFNNGRGPTMSLAPLAASTGMKALSVVNYQLDDISALAGMTGMTNLDLRSDRITDISALSSMTALKEVQLFGNEIEDVSSLANSAASITQLEIYANNVKSIEAVAGMTSLNELWASFNQIQDISPVRGATSTTFLDFDNNQVNFLPDLSSLAKLRLLALGFNQITEIANAAWLTSVEELYLNNNAISDIAPLSSLHNLKQLDLGGNPLNADAYSTWIPLIIENNPGLFYFKYDPLPEPGAGLVLLGGLTLWQAGPRRRRVASTRSPGILHEGVCDVEKQRAVGGLRCGILYGHRKGRGLHLGRRAVGGPADLPGKPRRAMGGPWKFRNSLASERLRGIIAAGRGRVKRSTLWPEGSFRR